MDDAKEEAKGKATADGASKPSIAASKATPKHPPMDPAKFKALSAQIGKALVDGLNKGAAKDHPPKP